MQNDTVPACKPIPKVVIVGGGFGGVYAARGLVAAASAGDLDVTIVNRTNYFLFTPLLHEVATGGLSPLSVAEPLLEMFRGTGIKVIQGDVTELVLAEKKIRIGSREIPYDYLVLATGAETNFYDIPGAEQHSKTLKDLADAAALRNGIIDAFARAALAETREEKQKLLSFAVVGGGATGVEYAGELAEFVHYTMLSYYSRSEAMAEDISICLVSAGPELLAQFSPEIRRKSAEILQKNGVTLHLGRKVVGVDPDAVVLEDGTRVGFSHMLWAAGVKPIMNTLAAAGIASAAQGRAETDPYLRAAGREDIFLLGDTAAFMQAGKPLPMLAQVASRQGEIVAKNILASIAKQPLTIFEFKSPGSLASLGRWNAVGEIYGTQISGPIAWFIWRTTYLFKFISWRKRFRVMAEWTVNLFYPRDITKLS